MNPFEMVVLIVAITFLAVIVIKRMELRSKTNKSDSTLEQENRRLQGEMGEMQKRMRVLERIVTDRGVETAAQIEALRERDHIGTEDKA